MINKEILKNLINLSLKNGGDFCEIYIEDSYSNGITAIDKIIDNAYSFKNFGIGIRIYKNLKSVYSYTNNISYDNLKELILKATDVLNSISNNYQISDFTIHNFTEKLNIIKNIENSKKIKILKDLANVAYSYDEVIKKTVSSISSVNKNIIICNSYGDYFETTRNRTRIDFEAIAENIDNKYSGYENFAKTRGYEILNDINIENMALEAARTAKTMLNADYFEGGNIPVVLESGFGGVIFHEACGHLLEADSVSKGDSIFYDKINKKIANDCLSAYDDATIDDYWGSFDIDDEGVKGQKTLLIENGILKNFLTDRLNLRRMNQNGMNLSLTGNGRRQNYKYVPTSRMSNTFIASGNYDNDEIIKTIDYGLYAKKMGGGSVSPINGEFNFSVQEAYLIKNGKIDKPLKSTSLIGKGDEVLFDIDMIGKNIELSEGTCGASSGSIPVCVGQPVLRVRKMKVGGK